MFNDLKFAFRQLAKSPGFTAVAVLTLALCIGANSAIFSVVHAILLKPYPWQDSERLVYVYNSYPLMGVTNAGVSIPDYLDRRAGVAGFADCALFHRQSFNLSETNEPERIVSLRASPSLFSTLQAAPALGRPFTDDEARPGAPATIVLSHDLWKNRFGSDRNILNRTIRLNGEPITVIGIMPEGFYFPSPRVQAWVPFAFTDAQRSDGERGHEYSTMIARLKPGATFAQVQRDLDTIQARNAERLPQRDFWKTSGFGGRVAGFLEQNVENVRSMLWLVQAGVAAALLIGCANVASLQLARATTRERELAIRAALGARRGQLVRLLLTESLALFLVGGGLGLLVAQWSVGALNFLGLSNLPRANDVAIDPPVFVFTLLCALATGLFFGALPAWSASRSDAATALKEAGTRTTAGHRTQKLRATLVITEIALATMLLSTAGLLVRSFQRLQQQDPGFAPAGVITAMIDLPAAKYDRDAKIVAFHDALIARLHSLPGVRAVGVIDDTLPFSGNSAQSSYASPDIVVPPGAPAPHAEVHSADPGLRSALGLTLLRGRWFSDTDTASAQRVVVIDRVLADRYWPGQNPLGKRLSQDSTPDPASLWVVIGVVAPVKLHNLEEETTKETIYFPLAQAPKRSLAVVVHAMNDPASLAAALRSTVRETDPEQPIFNVRTMAQRMEDAAQPRRAPMVLFSLFGGVALLLALLGVYGVLAFTVTQRTAEFGVRLALGATARDIAALVLRQGVWLVAIGVAAGLAGYLALSRIVGRLLFGVAPTDLVMLALAPALLALAAFAACLLPARRATRINPVEALRAE